MAQVVLASVPFEQCDNAAAVIAKFNQMTGLAYGDREFQDIESRSDTFLVSAVQQHPGQLRIETVDEDALRAKAVSFLVMNGCEYTDVHLPTVEAFRLRRKVHAQSKLIQVFAKALVTRDPRFSNIQMQEPVPPVPEDIKVMPQYYSLSAFILDVDAQLA